MNHCFEKSLVCDFCHIHVGIHDINFPEDLYDLVTKYKIEQLYWLCTACKKKKEHTFSYVLSLAEKQMQMEQSLNDLSDIVNKMRQATSNCTSLSSGYASGEISFIEDINDCSFRGADIMGSAIDKELDHISDSQNSIASSPPSEIRSEASGASIDNSKNSVDFRDQFLKTKIKINPEQEGKSKKIITNFLDMLTKELKEIDNLFKVLFQKIYYTGSFYEDLRIVDATEFDVNLVLKFPFKSSMRKIEYPEVVKSFAKYKLIDTDYSETNLIQEKKDNLLQVQKRFFEDGYLMPEKVKQWMQSMIAKLMAKGMPRVDNVKDVLPSSSGPAKTLKLITTFGYTIDVDLVPVIEILSPEWPKGADVNKNIRKKFNVKPEEEFWFLVPKTYCGKQNNIPPSEAACFWRMHFPEVEKKILYDRGMVKPIIKTLKLLRDKQDWKILSSYYLKTVVMWAVNEHPSVEYWMGIHFWDRLLMVLKKLQGYLEDMNIPYLFYPSFNLIEKIQKVHAKNLCYRLKKIISALEADHKAIVKFT